MLDWLEYILRCVTAEDEGEKLSEALISRPLILPPKQSAAEQTAMSEGIAASAAAAYTPLLAPFLQGRQVTLRDIAEQAARRDDGLPISLPDSALPLLYRRTEEAVSRTAAVGLPGISAVGQTQVITVQEGGSAPAGLTVHELDRAIRRDSRRFDGGMNLY